MLVRVLRHASCGPCLRAAGAVDDLAIMPLLRRGVKNIIACVALHTPPNGTLEEFATSERARAGVHARCHVHACVLAAARMQGSRGRQGCHQHPTDCLLRSPPAVCAGEFALSGLFGALPPEAKNDKGQPLLVHGVDDAPTWNEMEHVFPTAGFGELYEALRASHAAGDAHVFNRTYEVRTGESACMHAACMLKRLCACLRSLMLERLPLISCLSKLWVAPHAHTHAQVLPNAFMGVAGGYNVSVLWVLNAQSAAWESQLPAATQRWLERQRGSAGPYRDYPHVFNNLEAPAPLISLLSQQASWAFRAKKDAVLAWVGDAARSGGGGVGLVGGGAAGLEQEQLQDGVE